MFSGIVLGQGILTNIESLRRSIRLEIDHQNLGRGVRIGDSIAVNGCCLTVAAKRGNKIQFDVLIETWKRTTFQYMRPREQINLERPLRHGNPVGGHFITGHIDSIGRIISRGQTKEDVFFEIAPPRNFMRWIVEKGSVAVDGISLTIASVHRSHFGVWVIPHTLHLTTLGWKQKGDSVNLEGDILAKYLQKTRKL